MTRGKTFGSAKLLVEIEIQFGPVLEVVELAGVVGEGGCRLLTCEKGEVILKTDATATEREFYENFADELRSQGVVTPLLYASGHDEIYGDWILLEYIPHQYPRHRWQDYSERLRVLFNLHQATWGAETAILHNPYLPSWSDIMTGSVMDWYARGADEEGIKDKLTEACHRFNHLSMKDCCISGDTNPTNWHLRDGQIVLVDWERFGYGTPALDLGVMIPGIGNEDTSTEQAVAAKYFRRWEESGKSFPYTIETLTEQIILAKLFTMVEFIEQNSTRYGSHGNNDTVPTIQFIIERLPLQLNKLNL